MPLQALLTCIGNTAAAIATYRIARSNGWKPDVDEGLVEMADKITFIPRVDDDGALTASTKQESESLVGFEDLGAARILVPGTWYQDPATKGSLLQDTKPRSC